MAHGDRQGIGRICRRRGGREAEPHRDHRLHLIFGGIPTPATAILTADGVYSGDGIPARASASRTTPDARPTGVAVCRLRLTKTSSIAALVGSSTISAARSVQLERRVEALRRVGADHTGGDGPHPGPTASMTP